MISKHWLHSGIIFLCALFVSCAGATIAYAQEATITVDYCYSGQSSEAISGVVGEVFPRIEMPSRTRYMFD